MHIRITLHRYSHNNDVMLCVSYGITSTHMWVCNSRTRASRKKIGFVRSFRFTRITNLVQVKSALSLRVRRRRSLLTEHVFFLFRESKALDYFFVRRTEQHRRCIVFFVAGRLSSVIIRSPTRTVRSIQLAQTRSINKLEVLISLCSRCVVFDNILQPNDCNDWAPQNTTSIVDTN